jgi:cytochrome c biogenesis protein CcmG/thiol:disulfide interchange protein DsbE
VAGDAGGREAGGREAGRPGVKRKVGDGGRGPVGDVPVGDVPVGDVAADDARADGGPADGARADGAPADGVRGESVEPQSWAGAMGSVWGTVRRHRLASAVIAVCVAASLAAIVWAGTGSPAAPAADPAAPAFSFPVLGHSGQQISLSDYAGKPLIVNFFASWCTPCQKETPLLARFYRAEHGKVALVGLDENDVVGNALAFTRAKGVTYPIGWDPQLTAAYSYGVGGLPQTFFLNAKHHIVDRIYGAVTQADLSKGVALATLDTPTTGG